jgi:AhpD family alkylhydroperoxidase
MITEETTPTLQARMPIPVQVFPEALPAIYALVGSMKKARMPAKTLELVYMRASQINACGFCIDIHGREMRKLGESDARMCGVAAWRDAPYFTHAERAALALTEAMTRLSDQADAVPDEVWNEAARHYDEPQLASLVVHIGLINFFNRINVATRQVAGTEPHTTRASSFRSLGGGRLEARLLCSRRAFTTFVGARVTNTLGSKAAERHFACFAWNRRLPVRSPTSWRDDWWWRSGRSASTISPSTMWFRAR